MNIQIINGIQLPAFDVEMLALGKLIVVPFKQFQNEGKTFWLYPCQKLPNNLSLEEYYQPEYLAKAKNALAKYSTYPIHLKFWARCEYQWHINHQQKYLLPKIAQSTIWNLNALENIFEQQKVLKLLILRVYHLSKPCIVNIPTDTGSFYWNKSEDIINDASENDTLVVSDSSFSQRKNLILSGNISPYQNIESLQFQCENISEINRDIENLNHDIKQFLGWYSVPLIPKLDQSLGWIKTIAALGDRSIELDEGKSNYQAGTDFENITRKSLEFLGFTVDYFHKGGAGGVDVFCSHPYPLVSECKSGKRIRNDTAVQLLNLGTLRLKSQELFKQATKLIIGPGEPTTQLNDAAKIQNMAIINPETLEKLVQLQSNYRNSIDLFKLKEYLKPGQSDEEVEKYIAQVEQDIKLRSEIIKTVKELSEQNHENSSSIHQQLTVTEIRVHYNVTHNPRLTDEIAHNLLIELSSPLTGYLGIIKTTDWKSDKFYYLRDLLIN